MKKLLYAGSFDPITCGHLDLINRSKNLADSVIVAIFSNSEKKSFFSLEKRIEMLKLATKNIRNVKIDSFDGLLYKYVNDNGIDYVLRGIRSNMDFESEIVMAQLNKKYYKKADTIFLMTDPNTSFVSSSIVREMLRYNADVSDLVPKEILGKL